MAVLLRAAWWRLLAGTIVFGFAASAAMPAGAQNQQSLRFFRIGTGSSDGSYFPIGGLIASAISGPPGARLCELGGSCGVSGLIAVAQSTRGSMENVELIGKGQLESSLAQAGVAYEAYAGRGRFAKAPVRKLRAIASLYREAVHIVVRADSGITSVAELKGKRISVGEEGSGTLLDAEAILEAYGIHRNKVQFRFLKPGQASDALRNRQIDAFFLVGGIPTLTVTELVESTPIRLLSLSAHAIATLRHAHPSFGQTTIPVGTYQNVPLVKTITVEAMWVTSADMDEDLVYGITKALWSNSTKKLLESGGPEGKQITLESALEGLTIPLHPGAERFYREVGALKKSDALKEAPEKTRKTQ